MHADKLAHLRDVLSKMLVERGRHEPLGDQDSLFVSGRLDSLAATELIQVLESDFGLDLSDPDFDISSLDSLNEIRALIERLA